MRVTHSLYFNNQHDVKPLSTPYKANKSLIQYVQITALIIVFRTNGGWKY